MMAKLSALGRREWVRARQIIQGPTRIILEHERVYLSDGTVLQKYRRPRSRWSPWKRRDKWNIVKPIPELRRELIALGWQLVPIRGAV